MHEFILFGNLGFHHILDPQAFDHLLFVVTLCAVYQVGEWRKILVLITAFTIGHSATLVLSGLNLLNVPSNLVEFLIPITIVLTSLYNIQFQRNANMTGLFSKAVRWNYAMALAFGFIHGMGFAHYFRALMGADGGIVKPLFSFNVGIETGQVVVVGIFIGLHWVLERMFHFQHRDWNQYVSGLGGGGALVLIMQAIFGSS